EAPERGQLAVAGKAQVADAPGALLLQQVVKNAVLRVEAHVDVFLVDVVEKVKVKVVRAAAAQLLFEYLFHTRDVLHGKSGELVGEVEAAARHAGERAAHGVLAVAAVIA